MQAEADVQHDIRNAWSSSASSDGAIAALWQCAGRGRAGLSSHDADAR
jgi:hypothetical protein